MASRSAMYRKKMKMSNPEKYQEYLNQQRVRVKNKRDELKMELKAKSNEKAVQQKERERELAKERQRRYREKKRKQQENGKKLIVKVGPCKKTRNQVEEQRKYWREAKEREKAGWSAQKRTWVRRKDRDRKRRQRCPMEGKETNRSSPFGSKKTEWNVTCEVRSKLPETPEKFVQVLKNLMANKVTPRKRKALDRSFHKSASKSLFLSDYAKSIKNNQRGRTALKVIAEKLLKKASKTVIARETGLHVKTVRSLAVRGLKRKQRADKIDTQKVTQFYLREDISRVVPQKRYAVKSGPGYIMQISLKSAHALYCTENTKTVSFSKFASLRPKNVRLLDNTHHEYCVCVYCINIRYKLLILSRFVKDVNKKIRNEREFSGLLLCPKSDGSRFHAPECIHGLCMTCGNQEKSLRNSYSFILAFNHLTWNHWQRTTVNGRMRRVLQTKTGSGKELLDELVEDALRPVQGSSFIQHLFVANWQYYQFMKAKEVLAESWVLMVMDFAKNRTVFYQDEIKSAFFGAQQITMHPIVAYYNKDGSIIRDALIFISDDINHDFHAVKHFSVMADEHLTTKLGRKVVKKIIFSDGCGSQYKSRGPFADLSLATEEINRNFYGSEHGKGEGDGEIGVINRAVDRAVLGRQLIINNAHDMYQWCKEHLTSESPLSQRHFFFIEKGTINRERPFTDVKPLPQTRKIHQILSVVDKPYYMKVRDLSCFCSSCVNEDQSQCPNRAYVSLFQERKLKRVAEPVEVVDPTSTIDSHDDLLAAAVDLMEVDLNDEDLDGEPPAVKMGVDSFAPVVPIEPGAADTNLLENEKAVKITPSAFVWVACESEKGRIFHYVAQITNIIEEGRMRCTYLRQPYQNQPNLWTWGNSVEYDLDMNSIKMVLDEPEVVPHRSGTIYFRFNDIQN